MASLHPMAQRSDLLLSLTRSNAQTCQSSREQNQRRWFRHRRLWFSIDKVVHCNHVHVTLIIWTKCRVAKRYPHSRHNGYTKGNTQKRKPAISRQGGEGAECDVVRIEKLQSSQVRNINISEDRAETARRRRYTG